MTTYRLLTFVADPFSDFRIPLGALVRTAGGVRVVLAPTVVELKGTLRAAWDLARRLVVQIDTFDELPPFIGPQIVAGPVLRVPGEVADPVDWLARNLVHVAA